MMMRCVGFEIYKFSEPPLLAQHFFQSPPFMCVKIFGAPLNIFIPPPPLVILNEHHELSFNRKQFSNAKKIFWLIFVYTFH